MKNGALTIYTNDSNFAKVRAYAFRDNEEEKSSRTPCFDLKHRQLYNLRYDKIFKDILSVCSSRFKKYKYLTVNYFFSSFFLSSFFPSSVFPLSDCCVKDPNAFRIASVFGLTPGKLLTKC